MFNVDGTKNREITKMMPLEIKINRYVVVTTSHKDQ